MTPPPGPRTAAGRALLASSWALGPGEPLMLDSILAIEAEARAGLDVAHDHDPAKCDKCHEGGAMGMTERCDCGFHFGVHESDCAAYGGRDGLRAALDAIRLTLAALQGDPQFDLAEDVRYALMEMEKSARAALRQHEEGQRG